MRTNIMLEIYKNKTISPNQLQWMLLIGMLQCIIIIQLNILGITFCQGKSESVEVPSISFEEPTVASIRENNTDLFTYQIKKAEPQYNPIILKAATAHDVELSLVKAIIMAESGYSKDKVSRQGAGGLMQLMPGTAKSLGVKDIFNPEENIHAGVKYYKSLLNRFNGDVKLALAAYNAGARNVHKYKGVPPFKETRRYIKKVLEYQQFYKHGPVTKEITSL